MGSARADLDLAAEDLSAGELFEVVRSNTTGGVLSVLGRFDVGLDAETSLNGDEVALAAQRFIARHHAVFGDADVELRMRAVVPVTDLVHVVSFDQLVSGLRVVDAEFTVGLWIDGTAQSFNGRPVDSATTPNREVGIDEAVALLAEQGLVSAAADAVAFDGERWRFDGGTLEEVYSDLGVGAAWLLSTPDADYLLDQDTRVVISIASHTDYVTGPCNVRRRDFPRSSGFATSLNESASATITEQLTCEASEFFGTCDWQLRREPSGASHGIARILDNDGAEQQVSQSCSSQNVPQFTITGGDGLREQGAFYVANQMRNFMLTNVWDHVAPNRNANVRITVDNAGIQTALWNDITTDIDCNQNSAAGNACAQDVLSHEYGHYVVWTYDDVSGNCVAGQDEGDSLDETMANAFGLLFWLDDPDTDARYGTMSGFAFNNGPPPHTTAGTILNAAPSCPGPNSATDGRPFLQAVWELMWNRDCSTTDAGACVATSAAFGSTVWQSASQETVMERVGAAMGYALAILGPNITHQNVRAQMRQKIILDEGGPTGRRAQQVFSHHGLTCPSCCTGC